MRKHVVLALFAALVIALALVGCGNSGTPSSQSSQSSGSVSSESAQQSQSQESASSSSTVAVSQNPDEEFMPKLAAGLEARWKLSDQTEGQEPTVQLREQLVNTELEQLAAFKGATFKDTNLGDLANRYLAALDESLACLNAYDTNYMDFVRRWNDAYEERALVIKDLVDQHGFTMPNEYQESLNSLIEDAVRIESERLVPANIQQVAEEDIPATIVSAFQKTDGNTYRATVVNPGPATFDYYNLCVCLLDSKGGLVDQQVLTVNGWVPGAEAVFEFTANSEFASIGAFAERWWGTWPN